MLTKLNKKDLISVEDLTREEIDTILSVSEMIRSKHKNKEMFVPLLGKSLAMIFRKPSMRTRVSFEIGMFQLGGAALYMGSGEIQPGSRESVADIAKVMSRYVDGIMIRTFEHKEVIDLAENATIPVINGLTDFSHPCQIISDLLAIKDKKKILKGLTIAYVGDGNNVCNSWLFAAPKMEMNLTIASPEKYMPDKKIAEKSKVLADQNKVKLVITDNPDEAVKNADIIYTDVWASMGMEQEAAIRKKEFEKYQVNIQLVKKAKPDCLVMHCLPAHRGDEITNEVMDGPNSIVFDQAESRLHAQKGIMALLMNK